MAYVIRYLNSGKKKYPRRILRIRHRLPLLVFACTILFGIVLTATYGSLYWIVPGDPEVTVPAFEQLMDALSKGESFGEAVSAFCREVIQGGV